MMKKRIALLALALLGAVLLTGCVGVPTLDESTIDRPQVVVKMGEDTLEPTVTPDPSASPAATATPDPSASPAPSAEPVDPNVYNPVPQGATLTLTGEHASGIKSICYRFDGGQTTVVKQPSLEIAVPDGAKKLELYVIGGNEIASQWATYYFTAE
jgi:hypothetical protein